LEPLLTDTFDPLGSTFHSGLCHRDNPLSIVLLLEACTIFRYFLHLFQEIPSLCTWELADIDDDLLIPSFHLLLIVSASFLKVLSPLPASDPGSEI